MSDRKARCATCRFWAPIARGERGECRIRAVTTTNDETTTYFGRAKWPWTWQHDWCGEWQRIPDPT